jgi:nitrite transporter
MEGNALYQVEELAHKKRKIFRQSKLRYLMRSIVASMFI